MRLLFDHGTFMSLNGTHRGETIFIIGAGPQLASITESEGKALENSTCIGLNKTFYKIIPKYFLSAYIGEAILAEAACPEATIFHMRPKYEAPLASGIFPLRRDVYDQDIGLPSEFSMPEPIIYTKLNVALGATHLALILGAKRIVYIGVEQKNQAHFYHYDSRIRAKIMSDLDMLKYIEMLNIDHPYATHAFMVERTMKPLSESLEPFYSVDHTSTFTSYFEKLNEKGVEVFATIQDSVISDAGAETVPLSSFLS